MRIPRISGIIERRILVNYRADPSVVQALVPKPFRPHTYRGFSLVGICLIRFAKMRPTGFPGFMGIRSENAAHRIAVEWEHGGLTRSGVYIPRRDTNSRLNAFAGGAVFPGKSHHSQFLVKESDNEFEVSLRPAEKSAELTIKAHVQHGFPGDSIFASLEAASDFFKSGSVGYSATTDLLRYDGLELRCREWHMEALAVSEVRSAYFEDRSRFPEGSLVFDNALLMRNMKHEWVGLDDIHCA